MCLYNIQNTNIICLYDLTHLKDLWLILTLIFIRWNLEWINLLVCHETSAYTTRFRCTLSNTWNVPVPSGTIALQGSRASRGESCGWNLQKLDISSVHWMKPPRKRQVILFPRLMVASSEDEARVWPWVFTTSEHRKNPVPWWSGKSLPKKNKGALPFKIVRLIHVTESHLQFLGRPASKADASHR